MSDRDQTTAPLRWNLPPGGDNADGPRPSDGAITGIDGADICAGCGEPIEDDNVTWEAGANWHYECLGDEDDHL